MAIVGVSDVVPLVLGQSFDGADADAVIGPSAEDAAGEVAVLDAEIDAVVANLGAVAAMGDDDRSLGLQGIFGPKTEGEGIVSIVDEDSGEVGSEVAIEGDGGAESCGALDIVGSLERNGDWLSVLRLDSGFERFLVRFVEVNEGRLVCHGEW